MNQKYCTNCKKDFNENENYNWSCCVHRSEWGGDMWWCCGKTKQTAQGCKFMKHTSKNDSEKSEDEDNGKPDQFVKVRCPICKELGHKAVECEKDPNLRTAYDVEEEIQRVGKLGPNKKRMTDTVELTSQLLERITLLSNERMIGQILTYDDFNYNQFNKRIFELDIPIPDPDSESSKDGDQNSGEEDYSPSFVDLN